MVYYISTVDVSGFARLCGLQARVLTPLTAPPLEAAAGPLVPDRFYVGWLGWRRFGPHLRHVVVQVTQRECRVHWLPTQYPEATVCARRPVVALLELPQVTLDAVLALPLQQRGAAVTAAARAYLDSAFVTAFVTKTRLYAAFLDMLARTWAPPPPGTRDATKDSVDKAAPDAVLAWSVVVDAPLRPPPSQLIRRPVNCYAIQGR